MSTKRLDPRYNIALMASAGTGKTYNLALRVVTTLMMGGGAIYTDVTGNRETDRVYTPAGKILCLTFTRKATAEMAERVQTYLTKLANGEFLEDSPEYIAVSSVMNQSYSEIKDTATKIREKIFTDPSILQIKTIDSFTAYILRLFPFEAGINPSFNILADLGEEEIKLNAFRKAFKELPDNELYIKLFFEYINWTKELPYAFTGRLNEHIGFILNNSIVLKDKIDNASKLTPQDLLQKLENAYNNDKILRHNLNNALKFILRNEDGLKLSKTLLKKIDKYEQVINGAPIKEILKDIIYLSPEKAVTGKTVLPPEYDIIYSEITDRFKKHTGYLIELDLDIILHLASHVQHCIDYYKKLKNLLSYSDLDRLTYTLLHSEENYLDQDFLYFRLDGRIEHILVDEFQDTSLVQWRILEPLARESMSGITQYNKIGSFFCVGDSKQTIYRFRGSSPDFFKNIINELDDYIHTDNLDINHRSDRFIVDFANTLFEDADSFISPDMQFDYTFQKAKSDDPGYVCIKTVSGAKSGDRKLERQFILKDILSELTNKGWEYKDIAVLVSKRADGLAAHSLMSSENIPSYMGFSEYLSSRPAYRIINFLIQYIIEQDSYSLAGFLLTEPALIPPEKYTNTATINLYKNILDRYLMKTVGLSIYERIMKLGRKMSLIRRLQSDRDFMVILELIAQNLPCETNAENFIKTLDALAAQTPASSRKNGVNIMTVHGAKGLQFPVVILYDVNDSMNLSPRTKYFISRNKSGEVDIHRKLSKDYLPYTDDIYKYAMEKETALDKFEKINKLYVAATRAEKALFILADAESKNTVDEYILKHFPGGTEIGTLPLNYDVKQKREPEISEENKRFMQLCWHTLGAIDLSENMDLIRAQKLLAEKLDKTGYHKVITDNFKKYVNTVLDVKPEIYTIELNEGFENRQFGTALHECIYMLNGNTCNEVKKAVEKANMRFAGYLKSDAFTAIEKYINMLIETPQWIDITSSGTMYREKAIFFEGQLIVIDLYIKTKHNIIILDFKTGDPAGSRHQEYTDQLNLYAKALKSVYALPVEAFLVYLHNNIDFIKVL